MQLNLARGADQPLHRQIEAQIRTLIEKPTGMTHSALPPAVPGYVGEVQQGPTQAPSVPHRFKAERSTWKSIGFGISVANQALSSGFHRPPVMPITQMSRRLGSASMVRRSSQPVMTGIRMSSRTHAGRQLQRR